ncbi:hypothetical protein EMMF5_002152 [Cystobasidiomycetes sp. EMM_F5]
MAFTRLPESVDPSDGLNKPKEPRSVLLLRGAGFNIMNEVAEGTAKADMTDIQLVEERAGELAEKLGLKLYVAQTNHEGYLINHIHAARQYGAIIMSPGAYCHYAYTLYDAINVAKVPFIEVHVTNMYAKESFRKSIFAPLTSGYIVGCGPAGYQYAIQRANDIINEKEKSGSK